MDSCYTMSHLSAITKHNFVNNSLIKRAIIDHIYPTSLQPSWNRQYRYGIWNKYLRINEIICGSVSRLQPLNREGYSSSLASMLITVLKIYSMHGLCSCNTVILVSLAVSTAARWAVLPYKQFVGKRLNTSTYTIHPFIIQDLHH